MTNMLSFLLVQIQRIRSIYKFQCFLYLIAKGTREITEFVGNFKQISTTLLTLYPITKITGINKFVNIKLSYHLT